MRAVVVLGGYGRLGRLCVHDLASRLSAELVVAGRNLQRAESLALSLGERARGVYVDVQNPRTLARALEGAGAVLACTAGDSLLALQTALELRVPFVGVSPLRLEARSRAHVAELAWRAQVPVVLWAGALPGLPGILAEALVRRLPSIRKLRVASSVHAESGDPLFGRSRARWLPELWRFADPIGVRPVLPGFSADLEGFAESHCVDTLEFLEPPRGWLGRSLQRLAGHGAAAGFALEALAEPEASIEVFAASPLVAAAALASTIVAAILAGGVVPAGLSAPREALNPAFALAELEKRGVRVSAASR